MTYIPSEGGDDLEPVVVTVTDVHARGRRQQRGCLITFGAWLLALAVFFGLGQWVKDPAELERWEWLQIAASMILVFFAPAFGIMQAIDLKGYLDWKEKKTAGTIGFRLLIIFGSWLGAAVAGGGGLVTVISAVENASSMGVLRASVALVLGLGLLGLAYFLATMPFRRAAGATERETRLRREEYEERMAHPDFAGLESTCGYKLPALYKSLFGEESEWKDQFWMLYPKGVENDYELHDVLGLVPAHPDAFRPRYEALQRYLAFAVGEYCEYWLELGHDDPPVYSRSTELDASPEERFERVSERLSEFLSWPKEKV